VVAPGFAGILVDQFKLTAAPFLGALRKFKPLTSHVLIDPFRFRVGREFCAFGAFLGCQSILFGSRRHNKNPSG
jgi:hypothetical protein